MSVESLGEDVLLDNIFPLLDLPDLLTISVVSKYFHDLTQVSTVWHKLYLQTFASLPPDEVFRSGSKNTINWKDLFKQRLNGKLHTWGDSSRGRLGYAISDVAAADRSVFGFGVPVPHEVTGTKSYSIARIKGGGYFFVFSTVDGDLYAMGSHANTHRQRTNGLVRYVERADTGNATNATAAQETAGQHHDGPTPVLTPRTTVRGTTATPTGFRIPPARTAQSPPHGETNNNAPNEASSGGSTQLPPGVISLPLHRVAGPPNPALSPQGSPQEPPPNAAAESPHGEASNEASNENSTQLPPGVISLPLHRVAGPPNPTLSPQGSSQETPPNSAATTAATPTPATPTATPPATGANLPAGVIAVPIHRVPGAGMGPIVPRRLPPLRGALPAPPNTPQKLIYSHPVRFVDFSAGRDHVLALGADNGIYIWDSSFSRPGAKLVFSRHPDIGTVTSILATWGFAAVATTKAGVILIYDIGQLQALGSSSDDDEDGPIRVIENYVCVPHTTFSKNKEQEIVGMSGGTSFLVLLNRGGQVLYVKDADKGANVISEKPRVLEEFSQALESTNGKFRYIYGSYQHFAVLSDIGKPLFGHSSNPEKPIEHPELENIIDIAIGDHHFFALNSSGKVYAWGLDLNHQGVLGLGPYDRNGLIEDFSSENDLVEVDARRRTFKITSPVQLKTIDKPVFTIAAGGAHSAAIY